MYSRASLALVFLLAYTVRLTGTHSDQFFFFFFIFSLHIGFKELGPLLPLLFFRLLCFDCGFGKDRSKIGAELIQFSYFT
jgi:hypothetical protein